MSQLPLCPWAQVSFLTLPVPSGCDILKLFVAVLSQPIFFGSRNIVSRRRDFLKNKYIEDFSNGQEFDYEIAEKSKKSWQKCKCLGFSQQQDNKL